MADHAVLALSSSGFEVPACSGGGGVGGEFIANASPPTAPCVVAVATFLGSSVTIGDYPAHCRSQDSTMTTLSLSSSASASPPTSTVSAASMLVEHSNIDIDCDIKQCDMSTVTNKDKIPHMMTSKKPASTQKSGYNLRTVAAVGDPHSDSSYCIVNKPRPRTPILCTHL